MKVRANITILAELYLNDYDDIEESVKDYADAIDRSIPWYCNIFSSVNDVEWEVVKDGNMG